MDTNVRQILRMWISLLVLLPILSGPLHAALGYKGGMTADVPQPQEVKVALQSVLVAAAATTAAQNLDSPITFSEAQFISDASFANFSLTLDRADIGYLRRIVLESPPPAPRQMGFLEALFTSVVRIMPDYYRMIEYLRPQALFEGEVILSGVVEALRLSSPYPFRYEGRGEVLVDGQRFTRPFILDFSFVIPLEGPAGSAIIPLTVHANGLDYLEVAQSLFPLPAGVDSADLLKRIL